MNKQVLIVGGGLTGLSVASHLPLSMAWRLFERETRLGGHARTEQKGGFFFDKTGHWLHLREPQMKSWISSLFSAGQTSVDRDTSHDQLIFVERKARVFSHGTHTPYPFQANLFGLPPRVVSECLLGFIEACFSPHAQQPAANFADFCQKRFGGGISRHFMLPYNRKLWGVDPSEITAEWCSRFVPIPKLQDVVRGAVGDVTSELGYNARFLYPQHGGIETLVHKIVERLPQNRLHLNTQLEAVSLNTRTAFFGGEELHFDALVATLPLPELCRKIVDFPSSLRPVVEKLRCTSVRYLNVATRTPVKSDCHWLYVPEEKYSFYRVGVYSNAVPSMAPVSCGSLYVELSERGPIVPQRLIPQVVEGLVDAGVLQSSEDVLFADLRELEYAYVVFDDNYYSALAALLPFLERHNIYPRGRYGSWTYNSMEDCLLLGKELAEKLRNEMGTG